MDKRTFEKTRKEQSRRFYAYILWLYSLTLYRVWFEAMFEAQGLFMGVLVFTGIGVYFLVRALAKDYARRVGLSRETRFRHLLFKDQKFVGITSLDEIQWGESRP